METKANSVLTSVSNPPSLEKPLTFLFGASSAIALSPPRQTSRPKGQEALKILIAEDNRDLRDIVARMVKALGHEIAVASTGKEALQQVHEHSPDIVLLDIMMPEMDGLEFCQALQAEEIIRNFHIIITSARDALEDKVKGLELGAADYLTKPFSLAELRARLQVGERIVRHRKLIKEQQEQLEHLAREDALTKLSNRRHFDERLQEEWQRALRYGYSLSLLMCDIDHFKQVNDVYGHLYGDLVLKEVAQALVHGSRASDVVARYGGEEFVVLLCEARLEQAVVAAERLRAAVKARSFTHPSGSFQVTMSVGLTTSAIGESADPAQLLAEADEALYAAKNRGRDRVEFYGRR
ncbi:MAG: diguanylate cyclase [Candidatus Binatia bacterium]